MEGPSVVLVPPSPLPVTLPSTNSSPTFTERTSSNTDRTSSETTIYTIYSMYGTDEGDSTRNSSASITPKLKVSRPRSSRIKSGASSHLPYFDSPEPPAKDDILFTKAITVAAIPRHARTSTASRLASSYPTPSSTITRVSMDRPASTGHTFLHSREMSDITVLTTSTESRHSSRPASRAQSIQSRKSSRSPRRKSVATPPVPKILPDLPSTPQKKVQLLSPQNSPLPTKHPPYSPEHASKTSLVPSEGEDSDAFHVRNTYAELEVGGVKGDGFEEGIERTRARVGPSRASQFEAENALGDGTEKTQTLSEKELKTLASLDRYGFFTVPSHDRLILLPSEPLLKRLAPIPAGPPNAPSNAKSLPAVPPVAFPPKEASRIAKWTRMIVAEKRDQGGNIESWTIKPSKEAKFRERSYKGVPDRWRAAAWELMIFRYTRTGRAQVAKLGERYRDLLDKPSTYDIQIDLDVPRTITGHVMFRTRYGAGQRSLFHVLHCFSMHCEGCGYVQGMGPIAATLLCYFEPERVYSTLVRLHDDYSMHSVFSPGFPGLLEVIYIQERITQQMMPAVYAAFQKHTISTTSYATKWYITLFSNSVPFQTQLRLWDAFLLEGYDVFIAVAVAMVWAYRDHITASSANFETVLSLLSSSFVPESEDIFLGWIGNMLGDKKLRASMVQWRADWRALVAAGKDMTALL